MGPPCGGNELHKGMRGNYPVQEYANFQVRSDLVLKNFLWESKRDDNIFAEHKAYCFFGPPRRGDPKSG